MTNTRLMEVCQRIGKQLVLAAYKEKYPDDKGVTEYTLFAFVDSEQERIKNLMIQVSLIVGALSKTPNPSGKTIEDLLTIWGEACFKVKEQQHLIDRLMHSSEWSVGKALIDAIRMASEKKESE